MFVKDIYSDALDFMESEFCWKHGRIEYTSYTAKYDMFAGFYLQYVHAKFIARMVSVEYI